jgi:hypothetical protein
MRPRDWFSVGVRLFGVYVFFRGFAQLLGLFADTVSQASRAQLAREFDSASAPRGYILVFVVGYFALSYTLVFGGERLTRLAFHEPSPLEDDDPSRSST